MKKNTLVALGLVSMISLGMAAGTVKAAEKTAVSNSTGTVGFTTEFPVTPPPGPGTGPEIIPPNPGNGDDDLNIIYVTNFDFGTKNVFKGQDMNLYAYSNTYTTKEVKDDEGNVTTPSEEFEGPLGISIGNTKAYRDWSLQASATAFADAAGNKLNGLEMKITPAEVNNVVGNSEVSFTEPIIIKAGAVKQGTNEPIVTDIAKATGVATETMAVTNIPFGTFTPEKGEDGKDIKATYANGVSLFVPGTAEIENDTTYTSTITWTLSATAI